MEGLDTALYLFLYVSYVGVTLLLGVVSADDLLYWIDPRRWLLIPVAGGILAGAPMLAIFAALELARFVGVLREEQIMPGSLVIWTAAMIGCRISQYLRERRGRPALAIPRDRRGMRAAVAGLSSWRIQAPMPGSTASTEPQGSRPTRRFWERRA